MKTIILLCTLFLTIGSVHSAILESTMNLRGSNISDSLRVPLTPWLDALEGIATDTTPNDDDSEDGDVIIEIDSDEYRFPNATSLSVSSDRHLQQSRTILPLRVSISGIGAPTITRDQIYARIFSDGNSLKHHMARCSAGSIQFNPTNWGVMDIYIQASRGTPRATLITQATNAALSQMRRGFTNIRQAANHVMFIMPNMGDNYVGSAEVCSLSQNCISQFGDLHGTCLSVIMHEIGHNLGLKHAAGNGNEYGDMSGLMGVSVSQVGGPLSCYNAANHWYLNWFMDSRLDLTNVPDNPIQVKIPAYVDYSETASASDFFVLVKAGNFFLHYNRAKDYNSGSRMFQNRLVITWDGNPGPRGQTSLVTGLDMSNRYYTDGSTVSVQVCNVIIGGNIDYMIVSIGKRNTRC